MKALLLALIRAYQYLLSPWVGNQCRFYPTCSAYAADAIRCHGSLKGSWLGGDLTANLAAYYIDWKDIQVQANRVSDSIQFATNIGGAESYGLEFEFLARPFAGLSLAVNGSFNRAKVTDLSPVEAAISGAVPGVRLASPHFQGSGTLRYDFAVGDGKTACGAERVACRIISEPVPQCSGEPQCGKPDL